MTVIRTILFLMLFCASLSAKSQFIREAALGFGTNGISGTITHPISNKLYLGESFSTMNWKPSWFASPFNRNGLAIMHLKYSQLGFFLRWHPFGKETMFGYQRTGLYLTSGVFYKFNDDWITTSAYYASRRLRDVITDSVYYQTGEIKLNTYTQRIQPFVGIGFKLMGQDSKISLQFETGFWVHGKPDGFVTSTNDMDITESDVSRLEKLHRYLLAFPFFQLHVAYDWSDKYDKDFTYRF